MPVALESLLEASKCVGRHIFKIYSDKRIKSRDEKENKK